jgi:hypothetical protein
MSAATKKRGDKRARRHKNAATKQHETNKHCDETAVQKVLGPYYISKCIHHASRLEVLTLFAKLSDFE